MRNSHFLTPLSIRHLHNVFEPVQPQLSFESIFVSALVLKAKLSGAQGIFERENKQKF